jgi:hypothetical protein
MARQIDWDKELSDEDRTWAEQRPDMPAGNGMTVRERLAANDEKFGKAAKDAKKSRAERIQDLEGVIANAQNEIERLQREQAEEDRVNASVTGDPAVGLVRDNTPVDGERPAGAPEPVQTYDDEKHWTVARLRQEIESRNPDREAAGLPAMSTSGKRSELVERLQQDDKLIDQGEQG